MEHPHSVLPRFSTDIAAAWEVMDEMKKDLDKFTCFVGWLVEILKPGLQPGFYIAKYHLVSLFEKLTAEAICLASLRSVGAEVTT